MTALSVNVNKIALIRNSRPGDYPRVDDYAQTCIDAGAQGITVHPRPDQRHIRPGDVRELAALCASRSDIEFNIEGNPFAEPVSDYPGLLPLVAETRPQQCTLVPDSSAQLTSDHGFDLRLSAAPLQPVIARLKELGVRISLFMDPEPEQIKLAAQLGVERVELYTGPFAAAHQVRDTNPGAYRTLLARYFDAAQLATELGLGVNAGHDLNLDNLVDFAAAPGLLEVSIGHALIVDAIDRGLHQAVRAYLTRLITP